MRTTNKAKRQGLSKAAESAAKKLREEACKVSDEIALRTIARGLNPGWEHHLCMDEYVLLKHADWGDGGAPSVGSIAKFQKFTHERRMLARSCLLAARASNLSTPKHTVTYQLVMDVEHPYARDVIARIDVETGAVQLGKPWMEAEEKAKKILTVQQLVGEVCAVCGGEGGSIMGLWSLGLKPLKCCHNCDAPDERMTARWVENSKKVGSEVEA